MGANGMTYNTNASMDQIVSGSDVYGSDNEKIGTVADVGQNYFLVQKGFLFIKDLYLPTRTIARVDGERVYLNVPKHEAEHMAAEQLPAEGDAWYGTGAPTTTDTYTTTTTDTMNTPRPVETGRTERTERSVREAATTTGRTSDRVGREGENITVPVVEEQLRAGVREVEGGNARIVKSVTSEQESIDVPVQREEVYVTERAVNRAATPEDLAAMDRDIEIPLREQEVVTSKQAVVTGEVGIRKETVTETQRVSDTVRREEVHVEDTSNPRVHTEGFTAEQRTRHGAMNATDRARYERFTQAERAQYDAMPAGQQQTWAAEYDRRNPIQKVEDKITGRDNPRR